MSEDIVIEDPIGEAVTNPDGSGVRGKEARGRVLRREHRPQHSSRSRARRRSRPARRPRSPTSWCCAPSFRTASSPPCAACSPTGSTTPGLITNLRGYWNMDAMTFCRGGEGRLVECSPAAPPSWSAAPAVSGWRSPNCWPPRAPGCVVNGRDPDAVHEAAQRVSGVGYMPVRRPIRRSPTPWWTPASTEFGRIDILINCAGTAGTDRLLDPDRDQRTSSTSCSTPTWSPRSRSPGGGAAHGRAAAPARSSTPVRSPSSATTAAPATRRARAAVNGLTLAIAAELKTQGVRANVVCPGAKTRLSTGADYETAHRRA